MTPPFSIELRPKLLLASFSAPQKMLSWSINRPGFQTASKVAWLEVRNAELSPGIDPEQLVADRLSQNAIEDSVALVTSRSVSQHHYESRGIEDIKATCLATVGLSNGERAGERQTEKPRMGTINTLLHVDKALAPSAFIELVSIVAMARTAAIMDSGAQRNGVAITGTGTDCIVVAAPLSEPETRYAGMHTAIGEAAGGAVYEAIRKGVEEWRKDFEALLQKADAAGCS
jgi:adenosylcobinamide amidohydrolase